MTNDPDGLDSWLRPLTLSTAVEFARVAGRSQDALYRLALSQGLNACDAADVVQESLTRAYQRRASFESGANVLHWLMGIAMNVIREFRRRAGTDAAYAIESDDRIQSPHTDDDPMSSQIDRVRHAVARLPPRQREAVSCRHLLGLSVRQTAEAMGIAEGTVKAATAAGLQTLREMLRDES